MATPKSKVRPKTSVNPSIESSLFFEKLFPFNERPDAEINQLKMILKLSNQRVNIQWNEMFLKAVYNGHPQCAILIKDQAPGELFPPEKLFNMLRNAIQDGSLIAVRFLMKMCKNFKVKESLHTNLLVIAAVHGKAEIFKFLLGQGLAIKEPNFLFYVAQGGSVEILDLVIKRLASENNFSLITEINAIHPNFGTPLVGASMYNHVAMVQALIKWGARVEIYDKNSALMVAACNGHEKVVGILLEEINRLNDPKKIQSILNATHENGFTALGTAAALGSIKMVQDLLAAKADVNFAEKEAAPPLIAAVEHGHLAVVQLLLETGQVRVNAMSNKNDVVGSALNTAVRKNNLPMVQLLLRNNACPNQFGKNGMFTSIHISVTLLSLSEGNPEILKVLVENRGDLTLLNIHNNDAFNIMVGQSKSNKNTAVLMKILSEKIELASLKNIQKFFNCLGRNYKNNNNISSCSSMFVNYLENIASKLLEDPEKLNLFIIETIRVCARNFISMDAFNVMINSALGKQVKDFIRTIHESSFEKECIFDAVYAGNIELTRVLLEFGLPPNIPLREDGTSMLEIACQMGHVELVKLLVEKGAAIEVEKNKLLLIAICMGQIEVVKLLVNKFRADIDATFALKLAKEQQQTHMIPFLFKTKLIKSLLESNTEDREYYLKNTDKLNKLINAFCNMLSKLNPYFDSDSSIILGDKSELKSEKTFVLTALEDVELHGGIYLPFDVIRKVFINLSRKKQPEFNLETLGLLFYDAYEAQNKQDTTLTEEKKKLEAAKILDSLDEDSILDKFPKISRKLLDPYKLINSIHRVISELNALLDESDLFLSDRLAPRTRLGEAGVSQYKKDNVVRRNKLTEFAKKVFGEIETAASEVVGENGLKTQLELIKKSFLSHCMEVRQTIEDKISHLQLMEAKKLKNRFYQTDTVLQDFNNFENLCDGLNDIYKLLNQLKSGIEEQRRQEKLSLIKYKLIYKEEQRHESKLLAERKEDNDNEETERKRNEDKESNAAVNTNPSRVTKAALIPATVVAHRALLPVRENKNNAEARVVLKYSKPLVRFKAPTPFSMAQKTGLIDLLEMEDELLYLEKELQLLNQRPPSELSSEEQEIETFGFLSLSYRLMDIFKGIPKGRGKITTKMATDFRDVISHAVNLPEFTLKETETMLKSLLQYLRAIQKNDEKIMQESWELLTQSDNSLKPTLFCQIVDTQIEDEALPLSCDNYKKCLIESQEKAKWIKDNVHSPFLKAHAYGLFIGRKGGFAARIKRFYRDTYNENLENYENMIEQAINYRHRKINYQQYEQLGKELAGLQPANDPVGAALNPVVPAQKAIRELADGKEGKDYLPGFGMKKPGNSRLSLDRNGAGPGPGNTDVSLKSAFS